jgi:hypothetical protein
MAAKKIPSEALLTLTGVKPAVKVARKVVNNWACEQLFTGGEIDAAEQLAKEWHAAGVRHVKLIAKCLGPSGALKYDASFWRFNPATSKWSTLNQYNSVARRRRAA